MSFDNRANLAYATVATSPSPATSGTTLTLASGLGSLFPSTNFSIVVYPPNKDPLASNAEICYVTSRTGDVLTIVRAQQGTSARSIGIGWQVANAITTKDFTDIQSQAIQFISAGTTVASAPTVVFSNANGISFGANGQTITAAIAGGVGGVAISGGTNSQGTGTVVFSNSNGVSFGLDGAGVMTASAAGAAQSTQPVAASASNGSFLFSTLGFSNANNVTFGTSAGSIITASINPGAQSTQPVAASASNGSFLFSTLGFSNANNVTFGTSAGSIITASINPGAQSTQPVAASASNGSFLFSTLAFSNGNGVTFGTSAGSIISASVGAGVAAGSISAGANSVALGQVVFSNSNNISFGLNGSTVTASASGVAQSTQPVAASASNGSFAFSTLAFSNGNGVTFGTSAGSIISASVAGLTSQSAQAASASNGSFAFQTLAFSNANNVTFGTSAGSIITASVATAAAGNSVNFSAGTASANLASIVFSNSNGVSFGLNGSTITASASGGGGGAAIQFASELPYPFNNASSMLASASLNNRVMFDPFAAANTISFQSVKFWVSMSQINFASTGASSTASLAYSVNLGIYSRSVTDSAATNFSNSSILASHATSQWALSGFLTYSSSSKTYQFNWVTDSTGGQSSYSTSANSSVLTVPGFNGFIKMAMPFNLSLTPGDYWMARAFTSAPTGAAGNMLQIPSYLIFTFNNGAFQFDMGNPFGTSSPPVIQGLGSYSSSTIGMPATVNAVNEIGIPSFQYRMYHLLQG